MVEERNRLVTAIPIPQRFQDFRKRPRKEMKTEIDQAYFLIGAASPTAASMWNRSCRRTRGWSGEAWMPSWSGTPRCPQIQRFAMLRNLARTILRQTLDKLRQQPTELERQLALFNDWDEGE